jgi:hypothetical protein
MPENINDAVPTVGYAITALKRSNGDPKSPFYQKYVEAVSHFTKVHGDEAGRQLQQVAHDTAIGKGEVGEELAKYGRTSIASGRKLHPTIQNVLYLASDGQKPLDKFAYGFDTPATPVATAPPLTDKLAALFKK